MRTFIAVELPEQIKKEIEELQAQRFQFAEDRMTNRERAAQAALNMVRLFLIK